MKPKCKVELEKELLDEHEKHFKDKEYAENIIVHEIVFGCKSMNVTEYAIMSFDPQVFPKENTNIVILSANQDPIVIKLDEVKTIEELLKILEDLEKEGFDELEVHVPRDWLEKLCDIVIDTTGIRG